VSRSCRILASERGGYSVALVADKVVTADSAWINLVIGGGANASAEEQQLMAMAMNRARALARLGISIVDFISLSNDCTLSL